MRKKVIVFFLCFCFLLLKSHITKHGNACVWGAQAKRALSLSSGWATFNLTYSYTSWITWKYNMNMQTARRCLNQTTTSGSSLSHSDTISLECSHYSHTHTHTSASQAVTQATNRRRQYTVDYTSNWNIPNQIKTRRVSMILYKMHNIIEMYQNPPTIGLAVGYTLLFHSKTLQRDIIEHMYRSNTNIWFEEPGMHYFVFKIVFDDLI